MDSGKAWIAPQTQGYCKVSGGIGFLFNKGEKYRGADSGKIIEILDDRKKATLKEWLDRNQSQLQAVRKDKRAFLNLTRLNLKEVSRKITGTLILGARVFRPACLTRVAFTTDQRMATSPIPERNDPQTSQLFRHNLILPDLRARLAGQTCGPDLRARLAGQTCGPDLRV